MKLTGKNLTWEVVLMRILILVVCILLLFTHCCFYDEGLLDEIKEEVDKHRETQDLEIDPDLWERHVFPEGGEEHEE